MQFTEDEIGTILKQLWEERQPYIMRMGIRRRLLNLASGVSNRDGTGTWLPDAWESSELVIRALTGEVIPVLNNYKTRIAGNEPQVVVPRLSLDTLDDDESAELESKASEQERFQSALWHAAGGRKAQIKCAYSQTWGRAGWYLTLPRDASWGLPDRMYFQDPTDDEIDKWNLEKGDDSWGETAESWLDRRQHAKVERAGESLFTLDEFPPDQVLPRYQRSGKAGHSLKYGFTIEEMPESDLRPGSDIAISAAKLDKEFEGNLEEYGIFKNKEGKIAGGIPQGGEPGAFNGTNWTLARFVTTDEVYWYVTESPSLGSGHIVYYDRHDAGICPLVPVPARVTDQMSPGAEFESPMESIFAQTPLINQLETLLSNVATWNALGRFYIVQPDGLPLTDEEGNLITMSQEELIGGQAGKTYITMGEPKQIEIKADFLQSLLAMYLARYDSQKPSEVSEGQAGASAAAWQVSQLMEASDDLLQEMVDNHAEAVTQVHRIWGRWLRMLGDDIYIDPAPGHRKTRDSVKGMIQFDPDDFTMTFRVHQASQSSQQRIVQRQLGLELLQAGRIDEYEFYESYDLHPDPETAIVLAWAQRASDIAMLGPNDQVAPGSLLADIVAALRGDVDSMLMTESQNYVLATAEAIAAQAEQRVAAGEQMSQESTADAAGRGNVAETAGIRRPGAGMGLDIPSTPAARAP